MLWSKEEIFSVNNDLRTYDNIWIITTGLGYCYANGCLLDYPYVYKKHYKMKAIDLSKQQVLDAGPKATQQIDFTGNQDQPEYTTMFFIIEEAKDTIWDFSQEIVRELQIYFALI